MSWEAKINRHVAVYVRKTVDGNPNYVKRRPGIITAFSADGAKIVRVRHIGEIYGNATTGIARNKSLLPPRTPPRYTSV